MSLSLRRVVILVAILNGLYFAVEFGVAITIGSVSLVADSVDFVEDFSLNLLIAVGLGWSARSRARLGMVLAGVLVIPGLATLYTAWNKLHTPVPPEPLSLGLTGAAAMLVNLCCALLLARFRTQGGSLTRAAFLSARNDVLANVLIVVSAFVTAATRSGWVDLVVGLGIAAMNADAAREVWSAARVEHRTRVTG